jgi:hypothetical protein
MPREVVTSHHDERVPQGGRAAIGVAWATTLLVSSLLDIVCVELVGAAPAWLTSAKMGVLLVVAVAAVIWAPLRSLMNFSFVMMAFFALAELRPRIDFTAPALQRALGGSAFDARMQAEQTGKLAVSAVMIGLLLLLGYRRRDFFLARGDVRAPIKPAPLLGFPKPDPWPWFGGQWGVYIAAALGALLYLGMRPSGAMVLKVMPMAPSILFYAALNAFNEEMTYRAPMIATLEPATGSGHGLWMSAYFFGIAHYFGTPGGLVGGIASICMGWILGKAMIETRGLFWSWWIHALSDVVIFSFLAMSSVK